jgi:hypothetical protein
VASTELVGLAGGVGDEDVLEALRLEGRAVHDQPIGTYGQGAKPQSKIVIIVIIVISIISSYVPPKGVERGLGGWGYP